MSSPDKMGTKQPKRHPACPGKSRCKLPSCIHNAPSSNFSKIEVPFNFCDVNGKFGPYPSIRFAGGRFCHRLDAVSERDGVSEIGDKTMGTVDTMMFSAQMKITEMSGIIFDKIKSCLNAEMPV